MTNPSVKEIKKAQKESLYLQKIARALHEVALDDPILMEATISRTSLNSDKSICTVFCYTHKGEEYFNKKLLGILNNYKGPLRKILATTIFSKRIPSLIFKFDKSLEKQQRINTLLEQVKTEEQDDNG